MVILKMMKQELLRLSDCVSRRGSCMVIFATALMVITAGLWMARQSGREVDLRMRRDLMRQAADIAAAVNPAHMEDLSFTADDKDRPVFKRLSAQMRDYAGFTGVKNIYTMALRNGRIVFGPESLPEGHPYASPPGTVYLEPSQRDFDIFTTGRPQVQGPVSDEYGTFVTASAPVFNPYSGEVVAVIGIDVDASVWRAAVRQAQWIPARPTLILLLILLLSGLIIRYRRHHSPERKERRRYTETILSAVFLSLMTLVMVNMVSQAERASRSISFYQHVQTYAAARVEEFNDLQDRLDQMVSFFQSSKDVSREEFNSYCNTVVQKGIVSACVWLPAVTEAEVPSFLQQIRTAGWPDFSIWQKNKNGFSEPVALRPVYYPALYIAPLAGHEAAVGYDLYSEPLRHAAIKETLLTGLPTATDPIRFITMTNGPLGFFVFQPVNASVQQGLAAFAVRPESMLGEAPHHNKKNLGVEVCIFQLQPRGESVFMAGSYGRCGSVCFENEESGLGITVPVFRFGKTYAMRLIPDEVWLADHPLRHGWIAGLIGLLITFLFSSVVALITNRHTTLERMVDRRTAELSESQAALQLRESYLLAILENQNGRVWLKDTEGRFLAVNHVFALACGKQSEKDIIGKTSFDVWPAKIAETYHKDDLLVIEKGTSIVTEEVCDSGGRKQWFETYKAPVFSAQGEVIGITGYARDITDRKQAEAALRESEQEFRTLAEAMPQIVWATRPDGWNIYFNQRWMDYTGMTLEESCGHGWNIPFHPYDRQAAWDAWQCATQNDRPYSVESRLRRADGVYRWWLIRGTPLRDMNGKILKWFGTCTDIDDIKQTEAALRENERALREAQSIANMGSYVLDIPAGRWTKSKAMDAVFGVDEQYECSLESWAALVHPDDRAMMVDYFKNEVLGQGRTFKKEYRIIRQNDGAERWVYGLGWLEFDKQGCPVRMSGVIQDITDRKQAEERIRQLAQHLQDVREDERKRLSRELHDDLGQILTALKIDLLVVKDECTCSGEVKAKMGDMQTLLRDAIQSVHSLCRRLRPGALDDLDIEDALAGLIEDWKQRNRIACDLFVDVDDKMLSDEQKTAVFRMVQESLTNVSRYADATRVEISLVADEKEFHFSVADNGCGMEPGAVDKPSSFGLLGMRERMEALGGSLHIESSPGKGTRIEGTVPLGAVKKLLPPAQDESGGQPGDSRGV